MNASSLNIPSEFKVDITVDVNVPIEPEKIYRIAVNMMYEITEFPLGHAWLDRDWSSPDGNIGIFMEHRPSSRKDPSDLYTRLVIWGLNHLILSMTISKRYCQTIAVLKWKDVPIGAIYVARKETLRLPWKSEEQHGNLLQISQQQDEASSSNDEDVDIVVNWAGHNPIPRELIYLTAIKAIGDAAEQGLDKHIPALVTTTIQRMSWSLLSGISFPGILRPRHSRIAALKTLAKMQEDQRFQKIQVFMSVNGVSTAAGGFSQGAMMFM